MPQEERVIRGTSYYRRQECMVPQACALVIKKLANHTLVQPGRIQEKQIVFNTKPPPRCSRKTKRIKFLREMKTLAVVAATTVVVSSRQLLTGSRRVVTVEPLVIKEIPSQTSSSTQVTKP